MGLSVSRHVDVDPRARVVVSHASNVESRGRARVRLALSRPSLLARRARILRAQGDAVRAVDPVRRARARVWHAHAVVSLLYVVRARGVDLVYTHEAHRKVLRALRWWHVSAAIACAAAAAGGPPTRETFGRFFVDYVFWGAIAMACVFPLVPKSFRRDVPDMVYSLGFLPRKTARRGGDGGGGDEDAVRDE